MTYTLNSYCQASFKTPNVPRAIIYPNNTTAAKLLKHHKKDMTIIEAADCISNENTNLPSPIALMSFIDAKIRELSTRAVVVGLDAYLSLLNADGVINFMSELRHRLDDKLLNVDYLLSVNKKPNFPPRYQEGPEVVLIYEDETDSDEEPHEALSVQAYSNKWVRSNAVCGWKNLLKQMGQFEPYGEYTLILPDLNEKQAGIGNVVTFVIDIHEVAMQRYSLDAEFDDVTLEQLLLKLADSGQSAESYLETLFGIESINTRFALKRLLEMPDDNLWPAYIWALRKRLPTDSYISKVISEGVTHDNLLWKYAVGSAISVLSEAKAKKYAAERSEALKAIGSDYESLIVDFIGQTKESNDALQFLNCGTNAEHIEIVRRASQDDLSFGLPKKYEELFPTFADYFSNDFKFEDEATNEYFNEYRRYKVLNKITDSFVKRAFDFVIPNIYQTRDSAIAKLQTQPDTALLVVDAMGAEYMPLLLALAKRRGMNIELQTLVTAKLPTETAFNSIKWDEARTLPEIKSIDNIVHNGASKHEASLPERNFAETLRMFETEIMTRIADGLTRFSRVVVTADHGASRLAVIAYNEGKSKTLYWDGQPDDWRYSIAPNGVNRPVELDQEYFPETQKTYWIVKGYNRLPKKGGKLYELHGGATMEEQLVPLVVFTRSIVAEVPKPQEKNTAKDLVDEFEGLI